MATFGEIAPVRNALFDLASVDHAAQRTRQNALALTGFQQRLDDRTELRGLTDKIAGGDQAALTRAVVLDPQVGTALTSGLALAEDRRAVTASRRATQMSSLAGAILELPPEQQASAYSLARMALQTTGHDLAGLPDAYPGAAQLQAVREMGLSPQQQAVQREHRAKNTYVPEGGTPPAVSGLGPAGNLSGTVHQNESGGRMTPNIYGDGGDAAGPMQVHRGALADVNKRLGTNYTHEQLAAQPQIGKLVGDTYLTMMREQFGRDDLALGAYNAGPGAMQRALASGRGIAGLPASTQAYVQKGLARLGPQQAGAPAPPAPVQVASTSGTAGLPLIATDASPMPPPAVSSDAAAPVLARLRAQQQQGAPVLPATVPPGRRGQGGTPVGNPFGGERQNDLAPLGIPGVTPEPNRLLAPAPQTAPAQTAPRVQYLRNRGGAGDYQPAPGRPGMVMAQVNGQLQAVPMPGGTDPDEVVHFDKGRPVVYNKRTRETRYPDGQDSPAGGGPRGPYTGTSTEGTARNTLIAGDPASPEYADAYSKIAAGVRRPDGTLEQPDMSAYRAPTYRPPGGGAAEGGPDAPGGTNYGRPQSSGQRRVPSDVQKAEEADIDAIGISAALRADMGAIQQQIDKGELSFGPVSNLINRGLNAAGESTQASRNFASFQTTVARIINDSLRLNKGVQTEGDAQRAGNELLANLNDKGIVKQRLAELSALNERAIALRQSMIQDRRRGAGLPEADVSKYVTQPAAIGARAGVSMTDAMAQAERELAPTLRGMTPQQQNAAVEARAMELARGQSGGGGTPPAPPPPAVGEVRRGFRFNGGDPADRRSWTAQ